MNSIFSNNLNTQNNSGVFGGSLFNNGFSGFGSTSGTLSNGFSSSNGLFGGNYGGSFFSGFGNAGFNGFGGTFGSYGNNFWGFGNGGSTFTGGTNNTPSTPSVPSGTVLTTVEATEDSEFDFSYSDFEYPDGSAIGGIYIVSVPSNGAIYLNGSIRDLEVGDEISASDLGSLRYMGHQDSDQDDSFIVRLSTDGENFDTTNYVIEVEVEGSSDAPEALSTSVLAVAEGGTASSLGSLLVASYSDPDTGDEIDQVTITPASSGDGALTDAKGKLYYTSDSGGEIEIDSVATISAEEAASLYFVAAEGAVAENDTETVKINYTFTDTDNRVSTAATFTVQISDANDAPGFTDDFDNTITVPENTTLVAQSPITVGLYPGTDKESLETLRYSIGGLDSNFFTVDEINGEISFSDVPDYEDPRDYNKNREYLFDFTVTDEGGLTATTAMKVTIGQENQSISFDSTSYSVDENVYTAATIEYTAVDAGNGVTFSITGGDDEDAFLINDETGVLTFATNPNADESHAYGGADTYSLEVTIADNHGEVPETSSTITISVNDLHDEDPDFQSVVLDAASTIAVLENSTEGTLEISLKENDAQSGDLDLFTLTFNNGESSLAASPNLTFELSSGSGASNFTISAGSVSSSAQTATVSLSDGAAFDHELDDPFTLSIKVTDQGGNTAETDVKVSILDVNEPPVFDEMDPHSVGQGETSNFGRIVVGAAADPDDDDVMSYSIANGNGAVSPDGKLYYLEYGISGNWEEYDSFGDSLTEAEMESLEFRADSDAVENLSLKITASDSATPPLEDTADYILVIV